MSEKREEGIVLRSTPFKEADRILTLFTPSQGVVSLIVKKVSKKRPALVNLTTPLCQGEFVFRTGRSQLHRFIDGTIFDLHLPLRRSYSCLEYGGKMLNAILTSQLPGKPAPALYALLISYLKQLSTFPSVTTLWASFQLKLLKHEGLLSINRNCLNCNAVTACCIVEGESRCRQCCDTLTYTFTAHDWDILLTLFHTKSFETLHNVTIDPTLIEGIETLHTTRLGT